MRAEKMNTVCLLGSPRRGGNSDRLAEHFLRHANDLGAPVETFALSELQYSGCQNLFRCKTDLDHCGLQDDLTPVLSAISRAEVLVLASPVYFTSVSSQLKLAMDRFFSFFVPDYPNAKNKSRLSAGRHVVLLQTQTICRRRQHAGPAVRRGYSYVFRGAGGVVHALPSAFLTKNYPTIADCVVLEHVVGKNLENWLIYTRNRSICPKIWKWCAKLHSSPT